MCDTLCSIRPHATYFAKNSDRPVGEPQLLHWFSPRSASATRRLRTQYLDLGPDPGAYGFLGSQPTWLWGVEHGVNEHGVAVGNEKIWTTTDPRTKPEALLGMDIVRLALERACTAAEAREIICALVASHGQGGSGEPHHNVPYDSSFLVADAESAWTIETNHRAWAARRVDGHGAISNRISLARDWDLCSIDDASGSPIDIQTWRPDNVPTHHADHRLLVTRQAALLARNPGDIAVAMRDHGGPSWGNPLQPADVPTPIPAEVGASAEGVTVCMHVRDYQTTAASMIVELPRDSTSDPRKLQVWAALGSPCVSIYVPVIGPQVPIEFSDLAVWQRFDQLRVIAEASSGAAGDIRAAWAPIEANWWLAAEAHRAAHGTAWQPDAIEIRASFASVFTKFAVGAQQ